MEHPQLYQLYREYPDICHDTRKIRKHSIYWAIKGDRFDGNTFTAEAFAKGAVAAVIDNPEYKINDRCFLVDDTIKALQDLAAWHRKELGLTVIAITGSNGKTTTKELMRAVLSENYIVFATPGNLNNHIGLPLTLLQLKPSHEIAIIELGANHPGENALLAKICQPDYALITNIGKDHLEGFGSMAGVEKANMELFDYIREHDGVAFVNVDDARIARNTDGMKVISYGTQEEADITGYIRKRFPFLSVKVIDTFAGEEILIDSNLFGSFNLYNIMAAAAAGIRWEIEPLKIKKAIESYKPENNRSQIIQSGTNTFILDAYNANPSSMLPAIKDFALYPSATKVLIIGDMLELGEYSQAEHEAMLDEIDFPGFSAVGIAGPVFYSFRKRYPGHFFKTTEELKDWFRSLDLQRGTVYIKGSRGMKLESILGA